MQTLLIVLASLVAGMLLPIPALRKPPKIPLDKKVFYAEYIQSKEWQAKRKERIKLDHGKCRGFHFIAKKTGLHVHHKSYKKLGNEPMSHLITLCSKHHKRVHK